MANVGDIVLVGGIRHVVMEFIGNANGAQDARCVRSSTSGMIGIVKDASYLPVVETPVFEVGERVRVGKIPGTVIGPLAGRDAIRVQLDNTEKPLADTRYKMEVANGVADVPTWLLVFENRSI